MSEIRPALDAERLEDAPLSRSPRKGSPVRTRLLGVGLLVGLIATSAIVLERGLAGPRPRGSIPIASSSGAWFCPHGGSGRWKGWVVVTNPRPSEALVRVTSFGHEGVRQVESFSVPPFRQVYRPVPAMDASSATEVEYFGGWVAVAAVVQSGEANPATAASRCLDDQSRTWFIPDVATRPDESASLVVMNPFGREAQFGVSIRTERRLIKPAQLTPYVLSGRTSVVIPLREFVLEGRSERTTSVQVVTTMGRVIAGGVSVSEAGMWSEAGIPRPDRMVVLPAPGDAAASRLAALNPGSQRADVAVFLEAPSGEQRQTALTEAALAPGQVATYRLTEEEGVGVVARSARPVVMSRNTAGPEGDRGMIAGPSRPWRRWLVLPSMPPGEGSGVILLQNPAGASATVTLRLIGADGEVSLRGSSSVNVPAETTVTWRFPSEVEEPLSVLVTADSGSIVAAGASVSLGGEGYATSLGVPILNG